MKALVAKLVGVNPASPDLVVVAVVPFELFILKIPLFFPHLDVDADPLE